MTGSELRMIRGRLGLSPLQFARLIGYTGTDRNDINRIRRFERGGHQIPLYIARLVWLIDSLTRDVREFRPEWPSCFDRDGNLIFPEWPGYEFEHTPDPQHSKVPQ